MDWCDGLVRALFSKDMHIANRKVKRNAFRKVDELR